MASRATPATVFRPARPGAERTICVLGAARGGTSMVSGLLAQLGVPMGVPADDPNQEDPDFIIHGGRRRIFTHASDVEQREEYLQRLRQVIADRNDGHAVWGWKDPISSYYVDEVAGQLRNPHYVVVTRDPGAVASAEMTYDPSQDPNLMALFVGRVAAEYAAINDFVLNAGRPALYISYERAVRHPEQLIRELHAFVRPDAGPIDADLLERLVDYVRPERGTGQIVFAQGQELPPLVEDRPEQDRAVPPVVELACAAARSPQVDVSQATGPGAEALFGAAVDHLLSGHRAEADALAAAALLAAGDRLPMLFSGLEAVARAAETGDVRVRTAADLLVGCCNVRGLVALQGADAATALSWFSNGYRIARAVLEQTPERFPVCADLVWWLAFHAARSARDAGQDGAPFVAGIGSLPVNPASAAELTERAAKERLVG